MTTGPALERRRVTLQGRGLDVLQIRQPGGAVRTLVMLHEALGSAGLWKSLPLQLAARMGLDVLAYSRLGHGYSDPPAGPREADYLHVEAEQVLPALLQALGIEDPILYGQSDGASIALIYAASHHPRAVIAEAPHIVVEPVTLAGVAAAGTPEARDRLLPRLARHHADAPALFAAWHDTWTSPSFRDWSIEALLPGICCPLLLIQGTGDEYGTFAQLDRIAGRVRSPLVERWEVQGAGHSPHREHPTAFVERLAAFIERTAPRME